MLWNVSMRWQAWETQVIGVHSQQRLGRPINLQYSFLHPCNKAETWKQNIKGGSQWTEQINKHQWQRKRVSHSLEYPEGSSISGSDEQRWPLPCSFHLHRVIFCLLKVNTAKHGWKEDLGGEVFKEMTASLRKRCAMLAGRQMDNCVRGLRGKHWRRRSKQSKIMGAPAFQNSESTRVSVFYVRIEGLHNIESLYFCGLESEMESWKNSKE